MIPGAANPLLLASAQAGAAYNIERSIRLNAPDSAYLSRTPSVAGNRKTWTWAGWVKKVRNGSFEHLFTASLTTDSEGIRFNSGDKLQIYLNATANGNLVTTPVFRDASAWMHVQVAIDTTQATASNRIKLYVNGTIVTAFDTAVYPTQNYDCPAINTPIIHWTGQILNSFYASLYLADIHFVDGQALDPTSFGEFDANGVWQPKAYTGSYGTNGFHFPFSDNSTAAALGTDTSGAGNNWTVNNISVAAGAGNDSLVDTPTSYGTDTGAGGEVRGNYATLNPLDNGGLTLANGNLDSSDSAGSWKSVRATIAINSGKWYWEATATSGSFLDIGISKASEAQSSNNYVGVGANGWGYVYDGKKYNSGTGVAYGATYTSGDVISVAFDADNGTLIFYKNGIAQGQAYSGLTSGPYFPAVSNYSSSWAVNFGQRPFAYPVSGFKALCTTNLPEPQTITTSGSYTGNGLADGPFVYLNGVPTAMTVNGTAVTFGTHADKLSNGFKLRTTSTTYNQNAATYNYSVTSTGPTFKIARAQSN